MRLIDATSFESDFRRTILESVKEDDFTTDENSQEAVRMLYYFLDVIKEQETISIADKKKNKDSVRLIDADWMISDFRRAILEFVMSDDYATNEVKQISVRMMQSFIEVIDERKTVAIIGVDLARK